MTRKQGAASILLYHKGLLYSLSSTEDVRGDGHFAVKETDTKWEWEGRELGRGGGRTDGLTDERTDERVRCTMQRRFLERAKRDEMFYGPVQCQQRRRRGWSWSRLCV